MRSVFLVFVALISCMIVSGNELPSKSEASSCNVTGVWRNELGSWLQIKTDGFEVRGVYQTSVESTRGAAGPKRTAKILGIVGEGPQPSISFTVMWEKGSCSAWVGQCFVLPDGMKVLKTFWLLRSVAENLSHDWGSTRLGEDLFFQT